MFNFFKKKEFVVKPLLDRQAINEAMTDIDYHLDFVEDTNKGHHIEELRTGYETLNNLLKDYIKNV